MSKITWGTAMQHRTKRTAIWVQECLANVSADDIIAELFVTAEDPHAKELIKRYEKQILLAKIQPEKFTANLHRFFTDTEKYIRENKLYRKFFEFAHFVYKSIVSKVNDMADGCLTAYQNLLLQQFLYFVPERLLYGISSTGELYNTEEINPKLDYAENEYEAQYGYDPTHWEKIFPLLKKYGYGHFKTFEEVMAAYEYEKFVVNVLFHMTYFVDETNKDEFLPIPHVDGTKGPGKLPREWKKTEVYLEYLKERKYMLPSKGVLAKFKNTGNIKEILFKEKYVLDRVFMLFCIQFMDNTLTTGFF